MYKYSPLEVWYLTEYGSAGQLDEYLSNVAPFRPYGYSRIPAAQEKPRECKKNAKWDAILDKIERDFRERG